MHIIILTLLWLLGIWVASLTSLDTIWWWLPGATLLAFALPLAYLPQLRRYTLYLAYIASFLLGGARYQYSQPIINQDHIASYLDKRGVTISGQVSDEPDIRDRLVNVEVEVTQITLADGTVHPVNGAVLLRTPRFPIYE